MLEPRNKRRSSALAIRPKAQHDDDESLLVDDDSLADRCCFDLDRFVVFRAAIFARVTYHKGLAIVDDKEERDTS